MPPKEFKRYVTAMDNASALAQRDFMRLWARLEVSDPYLIRDALLELVPELIRKYSDIASTAAAEYYEAERTALRSDAYEVELSDGVPEEQIIASIRYACGHLFDTENNDGGVRPERNSSLFDGEN